MIFSNEELLKILPSGGPKLAEVQKYIDKYNEDYIVIKCGGSVLIDQILFDQLIEDISILNKLGLNIIVVHGGGKNIKKKLDEAKLKSKFINGLRITDGNTIKIVKEALTELNHEIINKLKDNNCKGISFSTNNNNVIKVVQINKELGFVGNPTKVNGSLILNEVESNADFKGLDVSNLRIIHAATHRGRTIPGYIPRAMGRSSPMNHELVHIEIIAG